MMWNINIWGVIIFFKYQWPIALVMSFRAISLVSYLMIILFVKSADHNNHSMLNAFYNELVFDFDECWIEYLSLVM